MRKPRDFDAELKALQDKTKALKENKVRQLGELVTATGADAIGVEILAGALLAASDTTDAATKEAWRERGEGFFQSKTRKAPRKAGRDASSAAPGTSGPASG
ncbi:conjugal transfer protein TraD [Parasphingopyxis algicola]|uniref:conjugal transfer protein TraD n=1 Tax=Parasphingopyxis algicola TaxID=2026624 RepID=UPI0015A2F011|nr:conjugal transfer protein TraD [Parasphingopyxis algicola]QLC25049.1 conjugal transfer protein TraD [Parasphingopyxis algicola]